MTIILYTLLSLALWLVSGQVVSVGRWTERIRQRKGD